MKTITNRSLSLLLYLFNIYGLIIDVENQGAHPFKAFRGGFVMLIFLSMIWYGEKWNDLTIGTIHRGSRINIPTPAFLISMFGWLALLTIAFG